MTYALITSCVLNVALGYWIYRLKREQIHALGEVVDDLVDIPDKK